MNLEIMILGLQQILIVENDMTQIILVPPKSRAMLVLRAMSRCNRIGVHQILRKVEPKRELLAEVIQM